MPPKKLQEDSAIGGDSTDDDTGPGVVAMGKMFAKLLAKSQKDAAEAQTAALQYMANQNQALQQAMADRHEAAQKASADQQAALMQQLVDSQTAATAARGAKKARLPQWDPVNTTLWFDMIEAQFASESITADADMYNQTLSYLLSMVVATLSDFIKNPPTADKYASFKKAVIESSRPPRAERFKTWLESSLGDRKPSDYLQFLQTLETQPGEFFRQNFLNKLPSSIREALSARDDLTLRALADLADKLVGEKRAA